MDSRLVGPSAGITFDLRLKNVIMERMWDVWPVLLMKGMLVYRLLVGNIRFVDLSSRE